MLDLIDLMNENYQPRLVSLDDKTLEISFHNDAGDHDVYSTMTHKQLAILAKNITTLYNLFSNPNY